MDTEVWYYRVGGLVFALSGPGFRESAHLARFSCAPCPPDIRVEVECVAEPTLPGGVPVHREIFTDWYDQGRAVRMADGRILFTEQELDPDLYRVQFSEYELQYYGCNMAIRILNMPTHLLRYGGVFLHASYIAVEGRAVLFAAPSGGGKSTQATLWQQHRGAQIVNGDRALLRRMGDRWYAFGSPYCGTSELCEDVTCPVGAVVLLGKSDRTTIRPASTREALAALLEGFTYRNWDRGEMEDILELSLDLIRGVPVFRLECRKDIGAVEALEEILWPKE